MLYLDEINVTQWDKKLLMWTSMLYASLQKMLERQVHRERNVITHKKKVYCCQKNFLLQ